MLSVFEWVFGGIFNGVFNAWLLQRHLTKLLCAVLHQPSTINCLVKHTTKVFSIQSSVYNSHPLIKKINMASLIVVVAA